MGGDEAAFNDLKLLFEEAVGIMQKQKMLDGNYKASEVLKEKQSVLIMTGLAALLLLFVYCVPAAAAGERRRKLPW